jgi:tetratricopeptide (TPR) repeat protein
MSPASQQGRRARIVLTIAVAAIAALAPYLKWRPTHVVDEPMSIAPALGMSGAPTTSVDGLRTRIADMENRLRERPHDAGAAVLLADALLRQARASADARSAGRAGELLKSVLKEHPGHYDALRLLGAVHLSQHRFREALDVGRRARDLRPADAWNYGIMGDALIELGEYEQAFEAIDRMVATRPSAAAYARVAYARELRGNLEGALDAMQMAAEATTAQDPEAHAWYASQVGELYLRMGKTDDADREYRRAASIFPEYPFAMVGIAKVTAAQGDRDGALKVYLDQLHRTPTLDLAGRIGDLYAQAGDSRQAEHYFQLAEDLAGPPMAQTEATLAVFLAEHDRKLSDAAKIAEAVASVRHDIFTEDAVAWAYFKTGWVEEAFAASQRALRTGTRDARILSHAEQIQRARRAAD